MNFCFLAIAFFAFSTLPLLATLTEPPVRTEPELAVPVFDAELVVKADNTEIGFWYLYFDTIPYYLYSMEESQDMVTWTPSPTGYFYGDGTPMKSFVCEGPMPAASTGSGGGTSGVGQPLRTLNIEITKVENLNINGYHLLRRSYTPSPDSPAYNPWDVLRSDDPLPFQTEGIRLFSFFSWTDPATNILWWVDATVTTLPQSTNGVPNALPTDSLAATDEEPDELAIFDAIKPQLIARLAVPPNLFPEPSASGPRKFARLRRTPADSNQNGLPDWWEVQYGFDPFAGNGQTGFCYPGGDPDNDGLTNLREFLYATDPNDDDSDNDNLKDGPEVFSGTYPHEQDSDGDGLTDGEEVLLYHTNPLATDTEHDGLTDFQETAGITSLDSLHIYLTNPFKNDSDDDGLTDYEEIYIYGTDPTNADTDGDGHGDGYEVNNLHNPNDPDDHPSVPDDANNPTGGYDVIISGESRTLTYSYWHRTPATTEIITSATILTSGNLSGYCSWPGASPYFALINSEAGRIPAPGLGVKFNDMGFTFPSRINCSHGGVSAGGNFSLTTKYLLPSGLETSESGSLQHVRVCAKISSPRDYDVKKSFLHFFTRKQGEGEQIDEENTPNVIVLTIPAGEIVSTESIDLTPSFTPAGANDGGQTVEESAVPIDLVIWNGQGAEKPVAKKYDVGAFTVANLNDTDGDGKIDNVDDDGVVGEKDLMKLYTGGYAGKKGKVKLTVKSGAVKFWEDKEKKKEIPLTDGAVLFDIPPGEKGLEKTLWVEATAASASVRDIVIWEGYVNEKGVLKDETDKVRATAVWATSTRFANLANQVLWPEVQEPMRTNFNDSVGAFGKSFNCPDGAIHYSIGFEYTVYPPGIGAEPSVLFDLTRQKATRKWSVINGQVAQASLPVDFPVGDLSNDDTEDGDESPTPLPSPALPLLPDRIHCFDGPGPASRQVLVTPSGEMTQIIERRNFLEFARVSFDGTRPAGNTLSGSRCSVKVPWRVFLWVEAAGDVYVERAGKDNDVKLQHGVLTPAPTP